jgi:hypothetical protein
MGKWQGVAMDPLKCHSGQLCPTFVCPCIPLYAGGPSHQGGWPAAVFYHFGHSTPMHTVHYELKQMCIQFFQLVVINPDLDIVLRGVLRGVSKGVEDSRRSHALQVACQQGVKV